LQVEITKYSDRIDYFKNKINAIELLPVMEFEGNESWGIISFHMALDKLWKLSKLKEMIDVCHQMVR
jgi:1,4-alpha-glucan branching enzyme